MNENDCVVIFWCVVFPILILIAAILAIYFGIQKAEQQESQKAEQQEKKPTPPKVEPISQKTDYCKLQRQYCEMDIILLRYEHIKLSNIDRSDYRLFKMEVDNIFDTFNEKEAFFEKYPSMKQRYQRLEYFLWRVSSHE